MVHWSQKMVQARIEAEGVVQVSSDRGNFSVTCEQAGITVDFPDLRTAFRIHNATRDVLSRRLLNPAMEWCPTKLPPISVTVRDRKVADISFEKSDQEIRTPVKLRPWQLFLSLFK